MMRSLLGLIMVLAMGCGGDDGGGEIIDDKADAGPPPNPAQDCELGGVASSNRYLPVTVGNLWRYRVTDPTGVDPETSKRQEFSEEYTPEGETEPVVVQVTTKSTGRTETWMRLQGERLLRYRQQDFTPEGLLERTTVYEPYRLRIDETAANLTAGAVWQDSYTSVIYDPVGTELSRVDVVDEWSVVSESEPCTTSWGELQCVQLHRERLAGGTAVKDYYFARGYGKVYETGGQIEELLGCSLY